MPKCPQCHGDAAEVIAPGFWRCTAEVRFTDSWGDLRTRICGYEYHEGRHLSSDTQLCSCGTFAVGRCQDCDKLVCGNHSRLVNDRRLCLEQAERVLEAKARETEAEAAAKRDSEHDVGSAISQAKDEADRQGAYRQELERAGREEKQRLQSVSKGLDRLLTELGRAGNPGAEPGRLHLQRRSLVGRSKLVNKTTAGWPLARHWSGGRGGDTWVLFLTTDGELWGGNYVSSSDPISLTRRTSLEEFAEGYRGESQALSVAIAARIGELVVEHDLSGFDGSAARIRASSPGTQRPTRSRHTLRRAPGARARPTRPATPKAVRVAMEPVYRAFHARPRPKCSSRQLASRSTNVTLMWAGSL